MINQTASKNRSFENTEKTKVAKTFVWIYFILLIFEGALRKWIFPNLATPLLVIRDPIAIWILLLAWKNELIRPNIYLTGMVWIGVLSVFTALFFGHGNLMVALYGARILLIHFPLMFVIGAIFTRDDVLKIGKVVLCLSIPMVVLMTLQFYSPQSAWVNRGIGGDLEGAGLSGVMGFYRPSGTFSFTTGNTHFFSLTAGFIFFFWFSKERINRYLLILSSIALVASLPLSISRTLLFSIGISFLFTMIAVSRNPAYFKQLFVILPGLCVIFIVLNQTTFFQTATEAFSTRVEGATEFEGGLKGTLGDRFLGTMLTAFTTSSTQPFWGYGLGIGTQAGSKLLTGNRDFLVSEEEWGRIIGETGLILGTLIVIIRLHLCLKITLASYKRLQKEDFLPWLLLSYGLVTIVTAQWGQPTSLGFSTLIGGLLLASFHSFDS